MGQKTDEYGTKYIGHIFKDAPYGYMHELYSPATDESIKLAEEKLTKVFPEQLMEFLKLSNGASFYSPSGLNIFGVFQRTYLPGYEAHPWRFPVDITTQNKFTWLQSFPEDVIVIGKNEGANTWIISMANEGPIIEYDRQDPDDFSWEWASFDDWLISEFAELFTQHDDRGSLLPVTSGVQ